MMLSRINSKNLNRVSEEGSFWQVNILSYAQAIYNLLYSKHNKKPPSINTPTRNRTNWSSCLQSTSFFKLESQQFEEHYKRHVFLFHISPFTDFIRDQNSIFSCKKKVLWMYTISSFCIIQTSTILMDLFQ